MKALKTFFILSLIALLIPIKGAGQEPHPKESDLFLFLIYPFVDCVEHLDNGDLVAHFGYVNATYFEFNIPAGGSFLFANKLSGTGVSFNEGQPEIFMPGTHHDVFSVIFGNGEGKGVVNWHLGWDVAQAHWKQLAVCEAQDPVPTKKITPVLECVDHNGGDSYTAHFGYYNDNDVEVDLPVGDDNAFIGLDGQDAGQPETFLVGRAYDAFQVDFNGQEIVWTLKGPDGNRRTATASDNPAQACNPPEEDDDADDDGIVDDNDAYPNDSTRAYDNYWPGEGDYGSLAFEDNWPGKGDYDFNDIVIDYNFHTVTDGDNMIAEMYATFELKASGAFFHNAFGFEIIGVPPAAVSSVEGTFVDELFTISGNGTEAEQEWATIILFDDAFEHLEQPGSGVGVNTEPDAPYVEPVTFDVVIRFKSNGAFPEGGPVDYGTFNESTFNPFIVADQERGKEIHLPDYPPTSKVNEGYLGNGDDDSDPETSRYYKTSQNLPWAINIYDVFAYPVEKVEIIDAHLKFAPWAQSSGEQFEDWYEDNPGYRNDENIYQIP